jgi:hypothetical protein
MLVVKREILKNIETEKNDQEAEMGTIHLKRNHLNTKQKQDRAKVEAEVRVEKKKEKHLVHQ